MSRIANLARISLAIALAAPLAAAAQSYRCTGKDGKRYYSSTVPRACLGQPIEQLNSQGTVIRRIDPAAEAKERAAERAEAQQKREHEAAAREAARRDAALLATYTSVADVEAARSRALADNEKAVHEIDERIAQIKKRQAGYAKEMEFYKGKNAPPAKLVDDLRAVEIDLKYQEQLRASKQKEGDAINARYDEDKKRFAEIVRRR